MNSNAGGTHLRAGLVLGAVLGCIHAIWVALVASGYGQTVMDFLFWLHMLGPAWKVQPFEPSVALFLILATATIGFITGGVASWLWGLLSSGSRNLS